VCCGGASLSWKAIVQVNYCINTRAPGVVKSVMPFIWSRLFRVTRTPSSIICTQEPRFGILEVILGGLDLKATDPRDKIFALLSFRKETYVIDSLP
jgi:hypothetical protein